jgi:hypothetical protein
MKWKEPNPGHGTKEYHSKKGIWQLKEFSSLMILSPQKSED